MKLIDLARILVWLCAVLVVPACAVPSDGRSDGVRGASVRLFLLKEDADTAYRENRWTDAIRLYGEVTRRVPEDAYGWFRLGNVHTQQGNLDRAERSYRRSIERDANRAKPWFNLATVYLLNARTALIESRGKLRPQDPATVQLDQRIEALQTLILQRIEEPYSAVGG